VIRSPELLARRKLLTTSLNAFEVIYIVLPTMFGLILVRESGVESGGAPSEFTPLEIFAVVGHYVVLELMMD